jgi:dGTPase
MNLASYASNPAKSKGRIFQESKSNSRNDFQRDRDRIIHSASFRRLQYKTQVFVNHEGDMFRSRLTHSLEVSQISRAIARTLGCHEDLSEAIALAHDLGHTPFGHAGQDALNECMKEFGGFEHNLQSLRVVDCLEHKYAEFDGLNLTFETREGILKHCSLKNAKNLGDLGKRFINKLQPSLEAQIVNFADEIAYCHHDLEDGLRSGILTFDDLKEIELFYKIYQEVIKKNDDIGQEKLMNEIIRRMMSKIIQDLCQQTLKNINQFNPKHPDDIRNLAPLVKFSDSLSKHMSNIKQFSRMKIYKHPKIEDMSIQAKKIITKLFDFYSLNLTHIPASFKAGKQVSNQKLISDYIAGMTDRFARQRYCEITA